MSAEVDGLKMPEMKEKAEVSLPKASSPEKKKKKEPKEKSKFSFGFKMPKFSLPDFDFSSDDNDDEASKADTTDEGISRQLAEMDGLEGDSLKDKFSFTFRLLLSRLRGLRLKRAEIEDIKDPKEKKKRLAELEQELDGVNALSGRLRGQLKGGKFDPEFAALFDKNLDTMTAETEGLKIPTLPKVELEEKKKDKKEKAPKEKSSKFGFGFKMPKFSMPGFDFSFDDDDDDQSNEDNSDEAIRRHLAELDSLDGDQFKEKLSLIFR